MRRCLKHPLCPELLAIGLGNPGVTRVLLGPISWLLRPWRWGWTLWKRETKLPRPGLCPGAGRVQLSLTSWAESKVKGLTGGPGGEPECPGLSHDELQSVWAITTHLLCCSTPMFTATHPEPPNSWFTTCCPWLRLEWHIDLTQREALGPSCGGGAGWLHPGPKWPPVQSSGLCLWELLGPGAPGHECKFFSFIPPHHALHPPHPASGWALSCRGPRSSHGHPLPHSLTCHQPFRGFSLAPNSMLTPWSKGPSGGHHSCFRGTMDSC